MIIKGIIKKRISIIKNFGRYLKKYKKYFLVIFLLNLLVIAVTAAIPYLYKILIDDVIANKEYYLLKWVILGYIALFLAETLFLFFLTIINNYVYNDMMFRIRVDIWNVLSNMSFSDFEEYQSADLKQRIDSDVDVIEAFLRCQVVDYIFLWLYTAIVGVLLIKIHLILGLVSFVVIPLGNSISALTGKGIWQSSENIRNIWGQYESYLQNSINGWKDIKALNAEKKVIKKFTNYWHKLSKNFYKTQLYVLINRSLLMIKDIVLTKMIIYFVGAIFIFNGELTVGSLLVFGNYFNIFNDKLNNIISSDNQFNSIIPSIERIKEIVHKGKAAEVEQEIKIFEDNDIFAGAVEFKNACFRYRASSNNVLDRISLKIDAGDCVAIVGRSGCGKSTLIKIILGLYGITEGEVTVSGRRIAHISRLCLNNNIGVVMQDSMIFNTTIKENLLLAKPTASDDEVKEACKQAYVEEFVSKLPEGLDTIIGEKGSMLSGGQRQRLAIARALLKNPKIIIFDEATSALDFESEKMISKAIENISKDRTVIIIAHRLSSILLADKVVVIDSGRVEAIGSHNELYESCETYKALFKEQYSLNSIL